MYTLAVIVSFNAALILLIIESHLMEKLLILFLPICDLWEIQSIGNSESW